MTLRHYADAARSFHKSGLNEDAAALFKEAETTPAASADVKELADFYLAYAEFRTAVPDAQQHFVPLYTMATSLEDAIDNILQIMAEYIGESEGGNVDVRTELDVESKEFNPPAALAIQSLRQGGDLRRIDAIKSLQKLNLIDADADPEKVLDELLAESSSLDTRTLDEV